MVKVGEPQLLQLKYRDEPWKVLVVCVLLNRTTRAQVDRVVDDLFLEYPTPEHLATARVHELASLLYPLGMHNNRAKRLVRFAEDWIALDSMWEHTTPDGLTELSALTGVGEYALDSYRLFVLGDHSVQPNDKELRRWKAWHDEITSG